MSFIPGSEKVHTNFRGPQRTKGSYEVHTKYSIEKVHMTLSTYTAINMSTVSHCWISTKVTERERERDSNLVKQKRREREEGRKKQTHIHNERNT